MKNYMDTIKSSDSEKVAIKNGYTKLNTVEIKEQIVGKQFLGGYLRGFKYIASINADGSLEGKNNYQHYDIGHWSIDPENHTLSVKWQYGWDNTTTHLYVIGKEIKMYDQTTGEWRSSFTQQLSEPQNIKNYSF